MKPEVVFTRACSVAELLERLLSQARRSVDAALYRLNNPRLAGALEEAVRRGAQVRVVLDRGKYEETRTARQLISAGVISFRLLSGRGGAGTKMHHKFAILDSSVILTGSYNWTLESEEENFESLLILREPEVVTAYQQEFSALWSAAEAI